MSRGSSGVFLLFGIILLLISFSLCPPNSLSLSLSRARSAFTLVELMIVIAIIGILAAALFPSMSQYISRSRDTTLMLDAKRMMQGLDIYLNDTSRYPPLTLYTASTETLLTDLKSTLVPQYIERIPTSKLPQRDKYTSNGSGSFYIILLNTEALYGSGETVRGHTCIFGKHA